MKKKSSIYLDILSHVLLVGATIVAIFPLVWIIISSVKGKGELTQYPTRFWPEQFTLDYFTHVINDLHFIDNIRNSLIIALATTLIAIIISAMAAYGIVRFFPKLGAIMSRLLVITYIFPPILLAIPYSIAIAKVGLTNSLFGLMMVYLSFSVPYAVWLLVGFFQTVPIGIEEAARIDGANKFVTFYKVVLPIVAPGIVATAIYTFINPNHSYLSQLDVTYKTPDLMSHFLPPHEVSFTFCCSSIVFPR
ncbi:ABC transporter permease SP1688 [Streptococcus pneumoniae]|nr:Diacetylchitobiose uptake system permease protein NgcG [Streptococcus pneumoniae]VPT37973.1 ABC transporter permease SP1688 [Streptococcus pneumoniae]VPZ87097.1 ABC transporter permease SP1688 [Streptococcus pneumoniae]VQH96627.1 ABC transporter permease SP1688 [Streptococcus pneumoniae]VQJ30260.1 ABC transporter permease SP1688 [Streptococcus pneumoniae]